MSVEVVFSCGGCDATAKGTEPIKKEFRSFSGRNYGLGGYRITPSVEDVAPEGWIAFDPFTLCTYCPACWAEICQAQEERAK
jgi:hypothetical protein